MKGSETVLPSEVDVSSIRQQWHDHLDVGVTSTGYAQWGVCMEVMREGERSCI